MKQILFFLTIAALPALTSCIKKETVIPNITVTATIQPGDWQYDNTTKTWYVNLDIPEITDAVNNSDGVITSISFDNNTYELVPDIYNGYAFYVTHAPGTLTLEAQNQFGTTVAPAQAITIKVVIVPGSL